MSWSIILSWAFFPFFSEWHKFWYFNTKLITRLIKRCFRDWIFFWINFFIFILFVYFTAWLITWLIRRCLRDRVFFWINFNIIILFLLINSYWFQWYFFARSLCKSLSSQSSAYSLIFFLSSGMVDVSIVESQIGGETIVDLDLDWVLFLLMKSTSCFFFAAIFVSFINKDNSLFKSLTTSS